MMYEQVSETHNSRPRYFGSEHACFFRKTSDGLADILKIPHNGIKEHFIAHEIHKCPAGNIPTEFLASFCNIQKEKPVSTLP